MEIKVLGTGCPKCKTLEKIDPGSLGRNGPPGGGYES